MAPLSLERRTYSHAPPVSGVPALPTREAVVADPHPVASTGKAPGGALCSDSRCGGLGAATAWCFQFVPAHFAVKMVAFPLIIRFYF